MKKKIRVGIIGVNVGSWATIAHIPALKALPDYEITAISNRNHDKAVNVSKLYDIPFIYASNHDLINSPEVDVVVIAVKVAEHRALVTDAINAGKIVFSEWPLGLNLEETKELAELAKNKGIRTAIGLQSRAIPAVQYVKDLIKEGYVGEVLSTTLVGSGLIYTDQMEQKFAYTVDRKSGAGMIHSSFSHAMDFILDTLGEFSELNAVTANRRKTTTIIETGEVLPMTAFDQIAVAGTLKSGAVMSAHYRAGMLKGTNFKWEITGTAGELLITAPGGHPSVFPLTVHGSHGDDDMMKALEVPQKYYALPQGDLSTVAFNQAQYYAWLAKDINEGTRLASTFEDAVIRYEMVNAIEVAGETGVRQHY
ncbi:Gfo/Idh/MocA family protein [Chitinophaga ginsengisoli]|uniref:Putative dehydrogenase n=1 Tax=Chitinophaga ginsengisoli TaxID=363837 RepID=A0A2P8GAG8_9BACT|nr:Gfo/Idh/MocA family oxidoreductase [Chitinophaga ginsengisoli]PSL30953.1 putative dehydrogenase [Chitinophaga ginsengisoli]